jgi:hypothetical protein
MILIVETRKKYGAQQEVHIGLTDKTKDRLRQAAWIGSWAAIGLTAVALIQHQDKKNTESPDQ